MKKVTKEELEYLFGRIDWEKSSLDAKAIDIMNRTDTLFGDRDEEIESGKVAEWEVEQSHHINRLICIGGEDKGQIHIPSKNTKTTARGMTPKRYMVTIKEIK